MPGSNHFRTTCYAENVTWLCEVRNGVGKQLCGKFRCASVLTPIWKCNTNQAGLIILPYSSRKNAVTDPAAHATNCGTEFNQMRCSFREITSRINLKSTLPSHESVTFCLQFPVFLVSGNTRFCPILSTRDDSESQRAVDRYSYVVIEQGHRS